MKNRISLCSNQSSILQFSEPIADFISHNFLKSSPVTTLLERTTKKGEFCTHLKIQKNAIIIPQIKIYAFASFKPMTELIQNYKQ